MRSVWSVAARAILETQSALKLDGTREFSIMLCDDAYIQQLNHDFRGYNKPTNVLSFPSDMPDYLGDIAISLETVAREAHAQQKHFNHHFSHMVVHGVLHLLGYDHEDECEAEDMETIEINVLAKLGIDNPYTSA
jgi:probable rRNA maturation factor